MNKFSVIIDSSNTWVDHHAARISAALSKERGVEVERPESLSMVGKDSLFGDPGVSLMTLKTPEEVKSFVAGWESLSEESIREIIEYGLVVACTTDRRSTKKLEAIAHKHGELLLSKESKNDNPAQLMLEKTNLKPQVKSYILDRVGEDYHQVVPVINDISILPEKLQAKIGIEDIALRMPLPPGSIKPWEIEKPIMSGDVADTIATLRRVVVNSHPLVVIKLMQNKISLMLRIASVRENDSSLSKDDVAAALGAKNDYPFKLAYESSSRRSFAKIQKAAETLSALEENLKGGSRASQDVLVEVAMVQVCRYMKE